MSCEDCDKLPSWTPGHPLPRIDYHHEFAGAIMADDHPLGWFIAGALSPLQRGL
jgi:hypothetical protein